MTLSPLRRFRQDPSYTVRVLILAQPILAETDEYLG